MDLISVVMVTNHKASDLGSNSQTMLMQELDGLMLIYLVVIQNLSNR